MADMDAEPDPNSESKFWRLTGFGAAVLESIFLTPPISAVY